MGNNVSNSNARTRRKFNLNLQKRTFVVLQKEFDLNVSNHARRTLLNKHGGCIISFLVNSRKLSEKADAIKRYIKKSLSEEQFNSYKKLNNVNLKVKEMKKKPKARIIKKLSKKSEVPS